MTNQDDPSSPISESTARAPVKRQFPCKQCGAKVEYAPGTAVLKCPYCAAETPIPQSQDVVEEVDYVLVLTKLAADEPTQEQQVVACDGCGAQTTLPPNIVAGQCAFCSASIVATAKSAKAIKPRSLLPFTIKKDGAVQAFEKWISSLWFAPGKLKHLAQREGKLTGMYVPFWTYDADTTSAYQGERGTDYTVTVGSGKDQRTETRTRWTNVSGVVHGRFDDVLIAATKSLPPERLAELEPWDLKSLVAYSDEFLSGFQAQSYQVTLPEGFSSAKKIMADEIENAIRDDIGGDHQRVHSVKTRYDDITFKHLLLPVWLASYTYNGKTFQILVNARTGEVQGDRPFSVFKIALTVIIVLLAIWGVAMMVRH
jgi:hypothetical protein